MGEDGKGRSEVGKGGWTRETGVREGGQEGEADRLSGRVDLHRRQTVSPVETIGCRVDYVRFPRLTSPCAFFVCTRLNDLTSFMKEGSYPTSASST